MSKKFNICHFQVFNNMSILHSASFIFEKKKVSNTNKWKSFNSFQKCLFWMYRWKTLVPLKTWRPGGSSIRGTWGIATGRHVGLPGTSASVTQETWRWLSTTSMSELLDRGLKRIEDMWMVIMGTLFVGANCRNKVVSNNKNNQSFQTLVMVNVLQGPRYWLTQPKYLTIIP